ncbi:hypothetical protein H1R13_18575 [Streptomyces mexicanus]|uniref:Uncharacterized protein n=1 Tax=Streptomyces mexicanus TaxID=178566 RepID=A0A7X1I249_9ACTN|nr:hypothetical protein [Streptomyces mexicanus]MBC2866900.1 hypothetical protein [Streptomyces mexicanus]
MDGRGEVGIVSEPHLRNATGPARARRIPGRGQPRATRTSGVLMTTAPRSLRPPPGCDWEPNPAVATPPDASTEPGGLGRTT